MENKKLKSFLGQMINSQDLVSTSELTVKVKHDKKKLEQMTKQEVLNYAKSNSIEVSTRKRKEELIEIIIRS